MESKLHKIEKFYLNNSRPNDVIKNINKMGQNEIREIVKINLKLVQKIFYSNIKIERRFGERNKI